MAKRKGKRKKKSLSELSEALGPLITIDESAGECLFLIADFISPHDGNVRRVISKRLPNGNIEAVAYDGPVGPDGIHTEKRNIMQMSDTSEKKFMLSIKVLHEVYSAVGGEINIRNFDRRSLTEVSDLMKLTGSGNVFIADDDGVLRKK